MVMTFTVVFAVVALLAGVGQPVPVAAGVEVVTQEGEV
jgi:hypothetical protein